VALDRPDRRGEAVGREPAIVDERAEGFGGGVVVREVDEDEVLRRAGGFA
jgi:hypothetical protein